VKSTFGKLVYTKEYSFADLLSEHPFKRFTFINNTSRHTFELLRLKLLVYQRQIIVEFKTKILRPQGPCTAFKLLKITEVRYVEFDTDISELCYETFFSCKNVTEILECAKLSKPCLTDLM
jgi:hypothetical protein